MRIYRYRAHVIQPKRDFPPGGYLSQGKVIKKGWVVGTMRGENCMPGATWFGSIREAKEAIDLWIRVKKNAARFWEILQPFPYQKGQHVPHIPDREVRAGRFTAIIENHSVTQILEAPLKAAA